MSLRFYFTPIRGFKKDQRTKDRVRSLLRSRLTLFQDLDEISFGSQVPNDHFVVRSFEYTKFHLISKGDPEN